MRTYPLYRDKKLFAFEISNTFIGIKKITLVLKRVSEVTNIKTRKSFSSDESDIHLRFEYQNKKYIVWEPYSDNSRYWIGPEEEHVVLDISKIEKVFSDASWWSFLVPQLQLWNTCQTPNTKTNFIDNT